MKKILCVLLASTGSFLVACSNGTSNNLSSQAVFTVYGANTMSPALQRCQNFVWSILEEKPTISFAINNNGEIAGSIAAPVGENTFDLPCTLQPMITSGNNQINVLPMQESNEGSQLLVGRVFNISDNGITIGTLSPDIHNSVTFGAMGGNIFEVSYMTPPFDNFAFRSISPDGRYAIGRFNPGYPNSVTFLSQYIYGYVYDTSSNEYIIPQNSSESDIYLSSIFNGVSNTGKIVGSASRGPEDFMGLICNLDSCNTYAPNPNSSYELHGISLNDKYIIGQQVNMDNGSTNPFYLVNNHERLLESGFGFASNVVSEDGVSIIYDMDGSVPYLYSYEKDVTVNAYDFIASLNIGISKEDVSNKGLTIDGISSNGKYMFGTILTAPTNSDYGPVTSPWKIYLPNGINSYINNLDK